MTDTSIETAPFLPFNRDRNVRQRDYAALGGADKLAVTKIFVTLQGEGPLVGRKAVFVRLAGCNFGAKESCPWCDTIFHIDDASWMTASEILDKAERQADGARLLVLTGGEPLMQPNTVKLLETMLHAGWHVQVETNGYFWNYTLHILASWWSNGPDPRLLIVVSPKVNKVRIFPKWPLQLFDDAYCLKIVIDGDDPLSPYYDPPPIAEQFKRFGREVFVSPIMHYRRRPAAGEIVSMLDKDTALDVARSNHSIVRARQIALARDYRLSLQQHLFSGVE